MLASIIYIFLLLRVYPNCKFTIGFDYISHFDLISIRMLYVNYASTFLMSFSHFRSCTCTHTHTDGHTHTDTHIRTHTHAHTFHQSFPVSCALCGCFCCQGQVSRVTNDAWTENIDEKQLFTINERCRGQALNARSHGDTGTQQQALHNLFDYLKYLRIVAVLT